MTKDMRQILDSLNGKQIVEESSSESPFKGFRQWALNEAWGGEPASSPTSVNVFQDRDPLGDGMWHWSCAVDGHIVRSGVAHTEEEAYDLAGAPKEDVLEPASHMLDEEPVMHLLRPRGGTECGEPAEEDTCTAEINHVTCPACIEGHDEYMRQFDLHEGKFGKLGKIAAGAALAGALAVPGAQIAKNAYTYGRGGGFAHAGMSMHDAEVNADMRDIGDKMKTEDEDLEEGKIGNAIRKAALGAAMSAPFVAGAAMGSYAGTSDYNQTHPKAAVSAPHAGKTAAHNEEVEEDVGNAEDHLDRMFNHHMAGHDDFMGQYDFWKGVNEDEDLDEGIHAEVETGPAAWASYLINGDASSMSPEDLEACDAWQKKIEPWYVVSTEEGEPRFTWSYRLYGGTANGGDVIDYIVHKDEKHGDAPLEEADHAGGLHVDYILDIDDVPEECIEDCSGSGDVSEAVEYWRKKLNFTVDREKAIRCLTGYGSWEPEELAEDDDDKLADRILWLACCNFSEWDGKEGDSNSGACQFVLEDKIEESWDEEEDGIHIPEGYSVYRNRFFTKRDYETSNIVAITAPHKPETEDDRWTRAIPDILKGLTMIYREGDVRYYGYL